MQSYSNRTRKLNLKFQSATKTKRITGIPENFSALNSKVEAMIKNERDFLPDIDKKEQKRDYTIKYEDGSNELINVSDDEDLQTAYEVALTELDGNLKFVIEFKKPVVKESQDTAKETKQAKKEKKEKVPKEKKTKKPKKEKAKKVSTKEPVEEEKVVSVDKDLATFVNISDNSCCERNSRADTMT